MTGTDMILIRLEGYMQSWGEYSKLDIRNTSDMPTKSGVIGMFASMMGLPMGSEYMKEMSDALSFAVRADRDVHIIRDYQTVYSEDKIKNAEGKGRCKTIESYRYYISDGAFVVAVSGPSEMLDQIEQALLDPERTPFLGRAACIPSRAIVPKRTTEYLSLEDAMIKEKPTRRHADVGIYEIDSTTFEGYVRKDNILNSANREYATRTVVRKTVRFEKEANI